MTQHLTPPYGGELVDLMVDETRAKAIKATALEAPTITLTEGQTCNLELLLCGALSPLRGFLDQANYRSILAEKRLTNGVFWPVLVMLDVAQAYAEKLTPNQMVALRDPEGVMLAALTLAEIWPCDPDPTTTGAAQQNHYYLSGQLEGITSPRHYDFTGLRLTPRLLRQRFEKQNWSTVIAYQPNEEIHRAEYESTLQATQKHGAKLLIHPLVGDSRPDQVAHYTRIQCYEALLPHYPKSSAALNLLPLAAQGENPENLLCQAIVQRNYGCSHFLICTNEIDPTLLAHQDELGIQFVPFESMVYVEDKSRYLPEKTLQPNDSARAISHSELRLQLSRGQELPDWVSFSGVINRLKRSYPARNQQGITLFFTGLSGAGKSTVANGVMNRLLERGPRAVTLLDGDIVRTNLSSELGFSKAHRDINVRRIGFVAAEITKNGGIAICAPIAPYREPRRTARSMVEAVGGFIEIYVSTSLEICEQRDRKGLYAKARAGAIPEFTGISDPYEIPEHAELVLNTDELSEDEAVQQVISKLESEGYLV